MTDETGETAQVWVFNGNRSHFPSAVFTERRLAEVWIRENGLEGTVTAYPLDVSVYEWAIRNGYFTPSKAEQKSADFIANFSSASQEHDHFENDEG